MSTPVQIAERLLTVRLAKIALWAILVAGGLVGLFTMVARAALAAALGLVSWRVLQNDTEGLV